MATSSRLFFIGLGIPTSTTSAVVIFESGEAGVVGARRILTHPDTQNFSPITYDRNPDRDFNLDTEVLPGVRGSAIDTLGARQVVRFEETIADVVVTEVWDGASGQASMLAFFFRQLYEYLRNPPVFNAITQTFITWQPRDKSTKTYNVQLFRLKVGSGSGTQTFNIRNFKLPTPATNANALMNLDVSPTGFILETVEVSLHVVSEVT